jgi:hypothetical protein
MVIRDRDICIRFRKRTRTLTTVQKENITIIYNDMKREALKLGQEILQIEKTANELFANKSILDSELQRLIIKSAENYGRKLRYIYI